ncbi:MAG: 50S ribosomal protein L11 methyltransferase [Saprospiraceae bacterium]|nr:50S ribosomal protein L11 methyltransferase [Saprospiraceae bacterium]
MKVYKSYTIQSNSELLLGMLVAYPFESFEEHEGYMIAYIAEDEWDDATQNDIHATIQRFNVEYAIDTIEPQNWNALWEASFEPVIVDDFCVVRADFHERPKDIQFDIVINPKMAFGTGHHETTYMMMAAMRNMDFSSKTVFDYGCGTGILAILASKMGCHSIDAIDIEEESYQNTIENAELNQTDNIHVACSDLENYSKNTYDIILANINRKVLLNSADELYDRLEENGTLLLSGILDTDLELVSKRYVDAKFKIQDVFSKGYWKCVQLSK